MGQDRTFILCLHSKASGECVDANRVKNNRKVDNDAYVSGTHVGRFLIEQECKVKIACTEFLLEKLTKPTGLTVSRKSRRKLLFN